MGGEILSKVSVKVGVDIGRQAASTMKPDQDHADRSTIEIDRFLTAVWNGLCGVAR
jgi:hypothetical protein